ncbi:MAG TPA: CBS domain-containing protein [Kofleriaceae bacterium]|nr:CBS domain-containing protein [Kofleriaceae bacterium]
MSRNVKTCHRHDRLERAAQLMWDHDIGAVPVVDDAGELIGMVTDRDACMAAYTQAKPLGALSVDVAMSKHVVTCHPDDTLATVSRLMAKHKIHRVPVIDDAHRPVGIVSLADLAGAMTRTREIAPNEVASTLAAICEQRPPMVPASQA